MKSEIMTRCVLVLTACLGIPVLAPAATIWNGPPVNVSNATQPDQITDNVSLERGSSEGLYNAATETGFTHFFSPEDTEWADGTTADTNYASLAYTDWNTWAKIDHGGPPGTVGVNAVVHLITDDIYMDIKFTSWSSGGGYSYQRATLAAINSPPSVTITNPASGTVLSSPATVTIAASASDTGGMVTSVQFLDGTSSLGNVAASPYQISASLAAGNHTLAAIATDDGGLTATNTVTISVVTPTPVTFASPMLTSGTNFQFSYAANIGLRYIVQRSTNLLSTIWLTIVTNTAAADPENFTDTNAPTGPAFYRVGRLPNP
jgi:Bacterial Ig domain